jgi:D-alanyl-D-alanine carboxypeptidase
MKALLLRRPVIGVFSLALTVLLPLTAGCEGGAGPPRSLSSDTSATPTASLPTGMGKALDLALKYWMVENDVVGVTAAVVTDSGSWAGAIGEDGAGVPLEPTSAMAIASITKTFVAAEVMLLSERGQVNLDAPLTDYVKVPFPTRGATVRQALAMRSGFPRFPEEKLLVQLSAHPSHEWTHRDLLAFVNGRGPRVGRLDGSTTGDMRHWYNTLNYDLLGQLVENVTGEPLSVVLRRDLIGPRRR